MTARVQQPGAIQGRHVLVLLLGFFAVVASANAVMIYGALSTFGGLDTPDAYRKGLAYNQRIDAAAAQAQLGWQESLELNGTPSRLALTLDRKSTRLNSSHIQKSRMPSSA